MECFLQIFPVHSWILTPLSQEPENLSRELMIGQNAGEKKNLQKWLQETMFIGVIFALTALKRYLLI